MIQIFHYDPGICLEGDGASLFSFRSFSCSVPIPSAADNATAGDVTITVPYFLSTVTRNLRMKLTALSYDTFHPCDIHFKVVLIPWCIHLAERGWMHQGVPVGFRGATSIKLPLSQASSLVTISQASPMLLLLLMSVNHLLPFSHRSLSLFADQLVTCCLAPVRPNGERISRLHRASAAQPRTGLLSLGGGFSFTATVRGPMVKVRIDRIETKRLGGGVEEER
ncbi:hypothetical protein R1sor_021928 [Riccia sorocarpa]|uniref:Uncharacterized protein n=1 Tax=Riccia sorocarpa TaxID=122646 RepID=A0ABD3GKC3_9MARC